MPMGGSRQGAGCGSFGEEPLQQVRAPLIGVKAFLPLYLSTVQAGFPSPADDYIERYLDLNAEYIKHPSATFLVKATGDSMVDVGIYSGDVLVVDKSLAAVDGKIVIAAINGELTVKRISRKNGHVQLLPANSKYKPIDITEEQDLVIWGVVTLVLHEPL